MSDVLFGIDIMCMQAKRYAHVRFALLTNNAATDTKGMLSRVALINAGFNIVKLFSPEHGLSAKGDDGAYQDNHIDSTTQIPVTSLYGDHLMPTKEDMDGIDMVMFDIPDAGCRFYTYLWTMTYTMEACAKFNKPFIVLDRPNPIGAVINNAEGPMLDEMRCSSFIGRWNIPVRHSCSLGELAKFFAVTRMKGLDITIIKVQDWSRGQTVMEAGWRFVPTSPAIKDEETLLLYPGMGLMEGINVNEGRGTASPFKIFGAPWMDANKMHEAFTGLQLAGIKAEPIDFIPAWGLYHAEQCHGLQLSVTDSRNFMPVKTGLALLQLIVSMYPQECKERLYITVSNPSGKGHLDKLSGVFQSFEKIQSRESLPASAEQWAEIIQPYLLY